MKGLKVQEERDVKQGGPVDLASTDNEGLTKKKENIELVSILSISGQNFMFDHELTEAQNKRRRRKMELRNIRFAPLSEYIEVVTLDPTIREWEEVIRIFIRTGYSTENVFNRVLRFHAPTLSKKQLAAEYWNRVEPFINNPYDYSEEDISQEEYEGLFENKIKLLEQNWQFGLSFDEDMEDTFEQMYFPEGNRELLELTNSGFVESIVQMLPLNELKIQINVGRFCEILTKYISLCFLVQILTEGSLKVKFASILSDPVMYREGKYYNWTLAKNAILRIIHLFEQEVETMEDISDQELLAFGQLPTAVVSRLRSRVLLPLATDGDSEPRYYSSNPYAPKNRTAAEKDYLDLITGVPLTLKECTLPNKVQSFFDPKTGNVFSEPIPVVVPSTWQCVGLTAFLTNPWSTWSTSKMQFLRMYFDFFNQTMISACLNNNIILLNLVKKHPIPEAFKARLVAKCSTAEASKLGTVQLAIYIKTNKPLSKGRTSSSNKRYVAVNSTSFFISPLARADLYFSFAQHCLLSQPCNGHKGLLLLIMIRMGHYKIAKVLISHGVNIDYEVCSLPAKLFYWKKIVDTPPKGCYPNMTLLEEKMEPTIQETKAMVKGYISETGIMNDNFIHEAAKGRKYTPFAAAVEMAYIHGNNRFVHYCIHNLKADITGAEYCVFEALLLIFNDIAVAWRKYYDKDMRARDAPVSVLRNPIDSERVLEAAELDTLGAFFPKELFDDMSQVPKNPTRFKLLRMVMKHARKQLKHMSEYEQSLSLRSILIHMSLMSRNWDTVRFFMQFEDEDDFQIVVKNVIDSILFQIIEGKFPFANFSLDALYFMMLEFDVFPSFFQFQRFLIILTDGILKLPFPRTGSISSINKLLCLDQFKFLFEYFFENEEFVELGDRFRCLNNTTEESFDQLKGFFEIMREKLCLMLLVNNFADPAIFIAPKGLLDNLVFLNDLFMASVQSVATIDSLPLVKSLVTDNWKRLSRTVQQSIRSMIEQGLSLQVVEQGFLTKNTVEDILFYLLTRHIDYLPQLEDEEIVADFSHVKAFLAVVAYLKNDEIQDQKEKIVENLLKRLDKARSLYWIEGLDFLFNYGEITNSGDLRTQIEFDTAARSNYTINYDYTRGVYALIPSQGNSDFSNYSAGRNEFYSDDFDDNGFRSGII